MSKKQKFIDLVNEVYFSKVNEKDIDPEILAYWNVFSKTEEVEKKKFTDNGKLILQYLKEHIEDMPVAKAKEIAEGLFVSSRAVSGAMRKLCSDGYCEKINVGSDGPVIYSLTEQGKNVNLNIEE